MVIGGLVSAIGFTSVAFGQTATPSPTPTVTTTVTPTVTPTTTVTVPTGAPKTGYGSN